ncbi:MAG: division/cell wall cluster transcriptional repressor MraZ [Planctomycetes bacterium]|nr:division/cell wall cluster transcriptional repressor MraZ [Planctomycetota bacterium]
MLHFSGASQHSLDDKGRLILPKRFLDVLATEGRQKLVLTAGFEGCLLLMDVDRWQEITRSLGEAVMVTKEQRAQRRMFVGLAEEVEPDKAGRITITDAQRAAVGLEKNNLVTVLGMGESIEVWERNKWSEVLREATQSAFFTSERKVG